MNISHHIVHLKCTHRHLKPLPPCNALSPDWNSRECFVTIVNSWVGAFGVLACFEIERPHRSLCIILVKASQASFKGRKKIPVVKRKNNGKDHCFLWVYMCISLSAEVHIHEAGGRGNLAAMLWGASCLSRASLAGPRGTVKSFLVNNWRLTGTRLISWLLHCSNMWVLIPCFGLWEFEYLWQS